MQQGRPDERKADQLRAITHENGLLSRADGSTRYSQGKTSVMVAVFGPMQVPGRKEKPDRATVEVIFKSASGSSLHDESDLANLIRQSIETVIISTLHPRTLLRVVIQELHDDGALLAASINGTCLALIDAAVPCNSMLAAVQMMHNKEGHLLLDPSQKEELAAESQVTMVFQSTSDGLVATETSGVLTDEQFLACLESGKKATNTVLSFFTASLSKTMLAQ